MADDAVPEGYASIDLPSWFWGGDPAALLADASVVSRQDLATGRWLVKTDERHRRGRAELIGYHYLAGPGLRRQDFQYLNSRVEVVAHEASEWAMDELHAREQRLEQTHNPVHAF